MWDVVILVSDVNKQWAILKQRIIIPVPTFTFFTIFHSGITSRQKPLQWHNHSYNWTSPPSSVDKANFPWCLYTFWHGRTTSACNIQDGCKPRLSIPKLVGYFDLLVQWLSTELPLKQSLSSQVFIPVHSFQTLPLHSFHKYVGVRDCCLSLPHDMHLFWLTYNRCCQLCIVQLFSSLKTWKFHY